MVRVYTIASGKGGTGKTTVSVNLGTMLAMLGKETYLMDADIGMANIGLILGLQDAPVTLHEILAGKNNIDDGIYQGPAGLKVIPSGISLQGFQQADPDKIRDVLSEIVKRCEFLLIDAPAGISKDGVVPLAVADEVILVVNPDLSSIVDALKTKILTEVVGGHVLGTIVNRVDPSRSESISRKMEKALGVKVIGIIPEDPNVRRAAAARTPMVVKYPDSPASKAIQRIASELPASLIRRKLPESPGKALSSGFQKRSLRRNPVRSSRTDLCLSLYGHTSPKNDVVLDLFRLPVCLFIRIGTGLMDFTRGHLFRDSPTKMDHEKEGTPTGIPAERRYKTGLLSLVGDGKDTVLVAFRTAFYLTALHFDPKRSFDDPGEKAGSTSSRRSFPCSRTLRIRPCVRA